MLDEEAWAELVSILGGGMDDASIASALEYYHRVTGFRETNIAAVLHHRIAYYGPPCHACGKPLRTPRASFCAACGESRRAAD